MGLKVFVFWVCPPAPPPPPPPPPPSGWQIETVGDAYIAGMAEPPLTAHHSPVTLGTKFLVLDACA